MPIIEVELPDRSVIDVDAPPGVPPEELIRLAQEAAGQAAFEPPPLQPPGPTGRGIQERVSQALQGAPQLAGEVGRATADALVPKNVEDLRPAFELGGAVTGSVLAGGPTFGAASVVGATGGTAAGGMLFEGMADVGRATGLVGPEGILADNPALRDKRFTAERVLIPAAFEALFPGLALGAKRGLGRLVRSGVSLDEAGLRLTQSSRRLGIPLTVENLSDRSAVAQFRNVIGRFPILGEKFRQADVLAAKQAGKAKGSLIHELSPVVRSVFEMGGDLSRVAKSKTRSMRKIFKKEYTDFFDEAESLGLRVSTKPLRIRAADLVVQFENLPHRVRKVKVPRVDPRTGRTIMETIEKRVPLKPATEKPVIDFAKQLVDLEESVTPTQYQALAKELNELLNKARGPQGSHSQMAQAVALRESLEKGVESLTGGELADSFSARIKDLNRRFAKFATLRETPTAQAFQRVDRNVFDIGEALRPGTSNVEELFSMVMNKARTSPEAMKELHGLVGKKVFRQAVATHIDNAFELGMDQRAKTLRVLGRDTQRFDLRQVRRSLGLGNPKSAEHAALKRALDLAGTDVRIEQLDEFFDVAERAFGTDLVDVNAFLARRASIGGLRSGIRAMTGIGAIAGAAGAGAAAPVTVPYMVGAGMALLAMRRFSRFLTDKRSLTAATALLNPETGLKRRHEMALRLMRVMGTEFTREAMDLFGEMMTDDEIGPDQEVADNRRSRR